MTALLNLVEEGKCVGDGKADDTAKFQAAILKAGSSRVLTAPVGKTFLISTPLLVSVQAHWDLRGSSIRKKDGMNGAAVVVSAGGTVLENFSIDGRREQNTKGGGIIHQANSPLPAVVRNVTVRSCGSDGFTGGQYSVQVIDYYSCLATDNVDLAIAYNASGFLPVGTIGYHDCETVGNGRDGFTVYQWAGRATFSGVCSASRNGRHGFFLNNVGSASGGSASYLRAYDNRANGVELTALDWHIDFISSEKNGTGGGYPGFAGKNPSATGFNMLGAKRLVAGTVTSLGNPGYGVAFTGASCDNTIGTVSVDSTGSGDGDPGLHFSGGSCRNAVGSYVGRSPTVGIILGEGYAGSNDDNFVGSAYVLGCSHGALWIDRGSRNHIGQLVSRGGSDVVKIAPGSLDNFVGVT